jgi:hypothetical protein
MALSSFRYRSRLYANGVMLFAIGMYVLFMSIPMDSGEAQNLTVQTTGNMQSTNMTNGVPLTTDCDTIARGNILDNTSDVGNNISSTDAVINIRCNLEEARHAIAADAADSALQRINEADNMIVALFGNSSSRNDNINMSSVGN